MRQFELTVEGKKHLFQETKTRENQEIWIPKRDGTIDKCLGRDLGPVDDNGLLSCPFCGSTLAVIEDDGFYAECPNTSCALGKTVGFIEKQYLVEACNQREAL